MNQPTLPKFIVFSEALTDMIRTSPTTWQNRAGGAGWNVARVMSWLGFSSAFAGAVSLDCFGDELWEASVSAGLDTRFMQRYDKSPLLAIVHQVNPVRYFFIGDDSADLHFSPEKLPSGWMTHVKYAYFGGVSLTREPLSSTLLALARQLKQAGVLIAYDPNFRVTMTESYDVVLREMAALADVIKISDEDLMGLFRTNDQMLAFNQLRRLNPKAICLYTCGAKNASLYAGDKSWRAAPPAVAVVDTVGAGDASFGGLLASLINSPEAGFAAHLRASLATGSAACTIAGAGLPALKIIAELAKNVRVDEGDSSE